MGMGIWPFVFGERLSGSGWAPTRKTAGIRFLDTLAALLLPFRYTICHCSPCRAGCAALVLPMRKPS